MYRVALNTALTTASAASDPRVEWLYQQIAQLKDVDRSVALLMLDGFSYKDISAIVGITESNVGVRLNRVREQLAEMLKGANE